MGKTFIGVTVDDETITELDRLAVAEYEGNRSMAFRRILRDWLKANENGRGELVDTPAPYQAGPNDTL